MECPPMSIARGATTLSAPGELAFASGNRIVMSNRTRSACLIVTMDCRKPFSEGKRLALALLS
jgi:hypothetical protein